MATPIHYTTEQLEAHLKWKLEHKEFVIQELDKRLPSPKQMGEIIYNKFMSSEFTNWNAICASAELLAQFSAQFPQIEPHARALIREIYSAHYLYLHEDVYPIDELQAEFAKSSKV